MVAVEFCLAIVAIYAGIGIAFAVMFVTRGLSRIDSEAAGGTLGFKLIILPACAALWPLLLMRWIHGERVPE